MNNRTSPFALVRRAFGSLRSRLVLRIYLVGLGQFFLVAVGVVLAAREGRRSDPSPETLRVVADSVAASPEDTRGIAITLANAEKLLHTSLAVYDDRHRLVAGTPRSPRWTPPPPPEGLSSPPNGPPPPGLTNEPPPDLPPDAFHPDHPPGPPPSWARGLLPFRDWHDGPMGVPIPLRDGRVWHLAVTAPRPLQSPLRGVGVTVLLVLIVVGISAWLTARSLAKPLARLSLVTHAFGAGDLTARADLRRRDELGEVAAAFDQMADRVTEALRAEKELLANVSHELRTPLQRIHIAIDLAAEGDAAMARESLGDIAADLAELERIVEDVLSAARLSLSGGHAGATGLPPIRVAPVDMATLLDKSVTRFRTLYPSRPLEVDVSPALPVLEVDAVLAHRAVDNLLDNAHKYSEDPRVAVRMKSWVEGERLIVLVEDHGVGIDTADQSRLFEPFFRADRSRTRGSGGLGLGLPLAKRIVLAHGGTLTLRSELGKGTSARIELPIPAPESGS